METSLRRHYPDQVLRVFLSDSALSETAPRYYNFIFLEAVANIGYFNFFQKCNFRFVYIVAIKNLYEKVFKFYFDYGLAVLNGANNY